MTNKKPFKLQGVTVSSGGVTRLQLFSQLATRTITNKMAEISREQKMSSNWPILTKLRCKLLRGCYTQATCLATLRKVEGRSTFLATCNATIAVAKWGVTREVLLATCNAMFVALQVARKIASCNMAFTSFTITQCDPVNLYPRTVLPNLRNYDHCLDILTQINEAIEATKLQPLPPDRMEQQRVSKEACELCLTAAISQELISYIKNANY